MNRSVSRPQKGWQNLDAKVPCPTPVHTDIKKEDAKEMRQNSQSTQENLTFCCALPLLNKRWDDSCPKSKLLELESWLSG